MANWTKLINGVLLNLDVIEQISKFDNYNYSKCKYEIKYYSVEGEEYTETFNSVEERDKRFDELTARLVGKEWALI